MSEKLGIELTKDISKDLIVLIKAGVVAYSDDESISKSEWFGLINEFIPVITDLTKASAIIAEIKDFDTQEGKEYLNYILSLGIVRDKATKIAKLVVEYIEYQIQGYDLYLKPIIKLIKQ